jgi:hypothetical protein
MQGTQASGAARRCRAARPKAAARRPRPLPARAPQASLPVTAQSISLEGRLPPDTLRVLFQLQEAAGGSGSAVDICRHPEIAK